jgi:hypothetical protein
LEGLGFTVQWGAALVPLLAVTEVVEVRYGISSHLADLKEIRRNSNFLVQ